MGENDKNIFLSLNEKVESCYDHKDLSWIDTYKTDIFQEDETLEKDYLLEIEFNNYTVKDIHHFCDYYKILRKRKRKNELIKLLIEFEMNPKNYEVVSTRRFLWDTLITLKEDSFFKKFILYDS